MGHSFPVLRAVVPDTTDARGTAEFYRQLLGYSYRRGDEPPTNGQSDSKGREWLVLLDAAGEPRMSFQQVRQLAPTTWPEPDVPRSANELCASTPH